MTALAPSDRMLLLARASVAKRLVREGTLDGVLALALAVWPSQEVLTAERRVPAGTLVGRAVGRRGNT